MKASQLSHPSHIQKIIYADFFGYVHNNVTIAELQGL